jgi:hypothetical protein
LDKAVFPRETENKENKGWKWLAPATLAELKIGTRKHLNIDSGYYEVSKSLAVAAGRYTESWIQVKNELAKFVRSAVLPMAAVSVVRLFRGQWGWAVLAAMASLALLMLYGRLKASHMRDLYDLAIRLSSPDKAHKDYAVTDLDNGVRLFFWKGKLASSAVRSPSQV